MRYTFSYLNFSIFPSYSPRTCIFIILKQLQEKDILIISESSLGRCCCKTFEDRVVSYSRASWGTCPVLGLKGQPADNQHLRAPVLLPVSVTGPAHPHTCQPWPFLHLHSLPRQWPCCLFSPLVSLWSLLSFRFILAVSILLPSELWLTFIVHPALRMIFLKGRSASVTPLLKILQWLLTALLAWPYECLMPHCVPYPHLHFSFL